MTDRPRMRRVVVYVEEEDYSILRSRLILVGTSVSQWVREKIKEMLGKNKKK